VARIEEGKLEVEGVEVFYRRVDGEGAPSVFVHGNPSNSDDWLPFLERLSGPGLAFDLPGWGRSGRPRRGYTMHEMAGFVERALAALEVGPYKLVVHDWGAVALIAAQREPARLERLVLLNTVPLVAGYRWHFVARLWRTRGLGWLAGPPRPRLVLEQMLRLARGDRSRMPAQVVDSIYEHWDRGTGRAILALYRSAPEPALAAAGAGLARLGCPALIVWGDRDPYLGADLGPKHAAAIPGAELREARGAGHWPWIDDPGVVDRVVRFLERP
jgi:pimeloyl-ACP methyl ester carboxylesterase